MQVKILIIDDEAEARSNIERYLGTKGYRTVTARNGSTGLAAAEEDQPDLVVCDVDMPDMDGFELCRILKKSAPTQGMPVILISGKAIDDRSMVAGLEGGADDYIFKPFSLSVLLARVKTVLRRYQGGEKGGRAITRCGVRIDFERFTVSAGGKPVQLSRKEFALLAMLVESNGRVVSKSRLLEDVWGYDVANYNNPHTIEVHISRLRKKLGAKIGAALHSVTGVGYKFGD